MWHNATFTGPQIELLCTDSIFVFVFSAEGQDRNAALCWSCEGCTESQHGEQPGDSSACFAGQAAGYCSFCNIFFTFFSYPPHPLIHLWQELNKVQKKIEEQAQSLKEKREQCTQLETNLKEYKDKLLSSEQHVEQLQSLNKVCVDNLTLQTLKQ